MKLVKLTKGGVCYDLEQTPFKTKIEYATHELVFCFSSQTYLDKFIERLENNRNTISESLSKRFGFMIMSPVIADIRLYESIEKRGFLIRKGSDKLACLESLVYDGVKLTSRT